MKVDDSFRIGIVPDTVLELIFTYEASIRKRFPLQEWHLVLPRYRESITRF